MQRPRERRLAWLLCAPALVAMLAVTAYPMLQAVWLSLHRYDLRRPDERSFVGLDNYFSVLGSEVWWQSLGNTLLIMTVSVAIEFVLGFFFAAVMHRIARGRGLLRAAVLLPYATVTVVAALAWRFAFDPAAGFAHGLLGLEHAWLSQRWSALAVIVATEVWKTTPFVALLLLAGLTLVPQDLLDAARVDGASPAQRFVRVVLPCMRTTILVTLMFRCVDAFRIFDTVFVQTRGALDTETVSLLGYSTLIVRLNLGLGSAVAVLTFAGTALIAGLFIAALDRGSTGPAGRT
jgi:multiple sugar transport system permease protein